jgi:hypothetical protein
MVANYVKLSGLNGAGLYSHALSAEIKGEPVDDARAVSLIALIDYRHAQRDWLRRRRNLTLTLTLLKLVGVLNGTNKLQPVKAAEAILVGKESAAVRTLFHCITLLRAARLY